MSWTGRERDGGEGEWRGGDRERERTVGKRERIRGRGENGGREWESERERGQRDRGWGRRGTWGRYGGDEAVREGGRERMWVG